MLLRGALVGALLRAARADDAVASGAACDCAVSNDLWLESAPLTEGSEDLSNSALLGLSQAGFVLLSVMDGPVGLERLNVMTLT